MPHIEQKWIISKGNTNQDGSKRLKSNDEIIAHGIDLEPRAADSMITPYKTIKYMFYSRNLRQNTAIVLSWWLFELTRDKAILKGDIIFNNQSMNGSIIINMQTSDAIYYHSTSRRKYPLEIDNRFKEQWDKLCATLQKASQLVP